jgi:NAD(P)H-flavin reductase
MMGIKIGGGESFDLNLPRALKKRGHNVEFVVGVEEYNELFLDNEFNTIKIKTPYL